MALFGKDPQDAAVIDIMTRVACLPREKQELALAMVQTYIEKTGRR